MTTKKSKGFLYKFHNIRNGFDCTATLAAYWEVYYDSISDDYTPKEISAVDLFHEWARSVRKKYPNGLIPISWFVEVEGDVRTFELIPFQFEHFRSIKPHNFLSFFTWPTNVKTGEPLNWLEISVVDKLWRPGNSNKGGFIQEATG